MYIINSMSKSYKSCLLNYNSNQLKRTHQPLRKILLNVFCLPSSQAFIHYWYLHILNIIRSAVRLSNIFEDICSLCSHGKLWNKPLHKVITLEVEFQLRSATTTEILPVLTPRNFISQEEKYHKRCIAQCT